MPPPLSLGPPGAAAAARSSGQATVELVALLPIVVVLLALAWQLVLLGQGVWSAHAAARAAARAHAVGRDELDAARAAVGGRLDRGLTLTEPDGDRVGVRLRIPILLPGFADTTVAARSSFAEQS